MTARAAVLAGLLGGGALLGACSAPSAAARSCDLPNVAAEHCEEAHELLLPEALPAARGNKYAEDEDAARFGFSLFFDSNLGHGTSCATCHSPELAFVDRVSVSVGKGTGTRNSPTTFNAARLSVFFWDGRADSLWSQPLFPVENPLEMDSTRLGLAHLVESNYREQYELVFGALPEMTEWPAVGKPGDASFDNLPERTRTDVNIIFANIGKAFEAYMRKNATSRAPLDAFLEGDSGQLLEPAQAGFGVFLANGCVSCHRGPMLTDESFHDVGFPSLPEAIADAGRADGLAVLLGDPFNLAGSFADRDLDEEPPTLPSPGPADTGAFRTPSLRNLTVTFPYGHDGALKTLGDVLQTHAADLSQNDRDNLLAFFQTLNGSYPSPPWNDWPSPQ